MSSYHFVDHLGEPQIVELHALYRGEWWCRDRSPDDVRRMLEHCSVIVGVIDDAQHLVAFARVLTDWVYKALVFDVIVHPDHRGQGLGDRVMQAIVDHPKLRNVEAIELYCLPGMSPFYLRWGFSTDVSGCVFMRRVRTAETA